MVKNITYSDTIVLNSTGWFLETNPLTILGTWTNNGDIVTADTFDDIAIRVNSGITVSTLGGNDNISGTSSTNSSVSLNSIVLNDGTINTGIGDDIIAGTDTSFFGISGYGIFNNGIIETEVGNDTITGNATVGIYNNFNSTINAGAGNDTITGIGAITGILNFGIINTGAGNDTITGVGGSASGIFNNSMINTGAGDDTINGILFGIYNDGSINTGAGNDTITGTNTITSGISNYGTIETGNGDDIVDALTGGFTGTGNTLLGNGADILKGFGSGLFDGGNGKDQLLFGSGTYTVSTTINGDGFYTISNGTIDMFVKNFELIGSASNSFEVFNFASVIGETFIL
jgi:hypothetical protein